MKSFQKQSSRAISTAAHMAARLALILGLGALANLGWKSVPVVALALYCKIHLILSLHQSCFWEKLGKEMKS